MNIENIYIKHVKLSNSYFKKYEHVPKFPGKKNDGPWNHHDGWNNHDFPRVWCLLDFIEWTKNISGGKLCYTCKEDPELEFIIDKYNESILLPYPPNDLHKELNVKNVDFFIFNQTLEHLYDESLAIQNIYNSLNNNGYVFTSVPTINIPHMVPYHFRGITPMGLATLFIKNKFNIINLGQWGNHKYIDWMFKHQTWPDINILLDDNGKIINEENNCCQCWILAQKVINE